MNVHSFRTIFSLSDDVPKVLIGDFLSLLKSVSFSIFSVIFFSISSRNPFTITFLGNNFAFYSLTAPSRDNNFTVPWNVDWIISSLSVLICAWNKFFFPHLVEFRCLRREYKRNDFASGSVSPRSYAAVRGRRTPASILPGTVILL